eukprot:scaffold4203_cov166-Ochromonas_danica.AAC.5
MEKENGDIVQWAANGLCFRIIDQEIFANDIVPKISPLDTKLTSFQRQLNLYGFRRLTKGEDQGCYFHPKFQRDRKELLHEIKRLPIKGTLQSYDQVLHASGKSNADRLSNKRKIIATQSKASMIPSTINITQPISSNGILKAPISVAASSSSSAMAAAAGVPGCIPSSAPKSMSKLTMNIGYGRNISFPASINFVERMPLAMPTNIPHVSIEGTRGPPTIPSTFSSSLPLPPNVNVGSNFASERRDCQFILPNCSMPPTTSFSFPSAPVETLGYQYSVQDERELLELFNPLSANDTTGALSASAASGNGQQQEGDYVPTFDEAMCSFKLQCS